MQGLLLCDFNNIIGASIVVETKLRVKVKYFNPQDGEIIRWIDKNEVNKIYRYKNY